MYDTPFSLTIGSRTLKAMCVSLEFDKAFQFFIRGASNTPPDVDRQEQDCLSLTEELTSEEEEKINEHCYEKSE